MTVAIVTAGNGRLTLGDPPVGATPCERCYGRAGLILVTTPLCKACLIDLVERGLETDR